VRVADRLIVRYCLPLFLFAATTIFAADPAAAKKFLAVGESKRDEKFDTVEHAAYAALCSAIMNLDEALTKE